ncbi:MAG TPA: helix-turn-helix transcriptional regulator [Blastocatellia bacterium]|jgi:AraC-like DNA-binding protein
MQKKDMEAKARIGKVSLVISARSGAGDITALRNLRIRQAIRLINEQYQQTGLTLGQIAGQLNLSVWHLSRLFKKETGESVKQYLRAVRMIKAQELLLNSVFSIKEIAAAVGYNHVSDFDHHFKATFNMRPGEYRQVHSDEANLSRSKNAQQIASNPNE